MIWKRQRLDCYVVVADDCYEEVLGRPYWSLNTARRWGGRSGWRKGGEGLERERNKQGQYSLWKGNGVPFQDT